MRSITRLKRMIEMANGQMPAPCSCPTTTLSSAKSLAKRPSSNMRVIKPNDVAIRAMKQPQKIKRLALLGAEESETPDADGVDMGSVWGWMTKNSGGA